MKTFKITFNGKIKNAIGICYIITDIFQGENEEKARLNMYDKYDHIRVIEIKELIK